MAWPVMHHCSLKSSLKRHQNLCRFSELPLWLRCSIFETGLYQRVSLAQIHCLLFLRVNSPAYDRSNLPGENLSKYKAAVEFASLILVTAFLFGQSSWIQNIYFLIENCLPQAFRIKFDSNTPSESVVARKSNFIELGSECDYGEP